MSAFGWLATTTVAVTSTTGDELDPYDVSPGLIGFLVTAAVVVVVIVLMLNMVGRMRRLSRRPEPGAEAPEDAADTPATPPAGADRDPQHLTDGA